MNPARWSLRRRLALSLAGMSLLGYIVLSVVWYILYRAWSSVMDWANYPCLNLPGAYQCAGFETWPTRFISIGLAAAVLAGSAWAWWFLTSQLLRPLQMVADAVRRVDRRTSPSVSG